MLVKYSVALAFGLGGIAAAVRFRNTLDDSKDAVYVFLVIGLGHRRGGRHAGGARDLVAVQRRDRGALWLTDFGRTPVALEGRTPSAGWRARASSREPGRSSRASMTKCSET